MATEQDIIDATYIKKANQIKLAIKKALIAKTEPDTKNMIKHEQFFRIFEENNVTIDSKARKFIEKRYLDKNSMLPFKDVLSRLTWDLSKAKPLESPWVIRKQGGNREGERDEILSIASSYFLTSVLSAKSKRMNIDNIIHEEEQVMDRVKKIDDVLKQHGAQSEADAKQELIERATKQSHQNEPLEPIEEQGNFITF